MKKPTKSGLFKKTISQDISHKKSRNIFFSFGYALRGLSRAFRSERNLRVHLFVAAYVIFFSRYYDLTRGEFAVLILAVGLVITCELFNTSIEKAVDLASPTYSELAKIAKDVAAAAVLISSLASFVVGVYFFWDWEIITHIAMDMMDKFYLFLPLLLLSLVIIFMPDIKRQFSPPTTNEKDDNRE